MEELAADTRSRSAVAAGIAQMDMELGLGTAVVRPPAGGGRGPVIPPTYWLEQQRALWKQPALPLSDAALKHQFGLLSVEARRAIVAAAPAGSKRPHGNTAAARLQKAARIEGQARATHAGEQVDVLFRAAAAGRAASKYSLRPAAAQHAGAAVHEDDVAEGDAASKGDRARSGAAFLGTQVAVAFELGSTVVFMRGDVISASAGQYTVRYVDGDECSLSKAAVLVGIQDFNSMRLRTDGVFVGTRADAERAYAAAGVPLLPAETVEAAGPSAPRRATRTGGASKSTPAATKQQLTTADALRRLLARSERLFVPAAPPRGGAARRDAGCASVTNMLNSEPLADRSAWFVLS